MFNLSSSSRSIDGSCGTHYAAVRRADGAIALPARRRLQLRRGEDLHAGRREEADLRALRRHVPPDTTAAIFWLKNRDPARWRDAWQLEHVTGKYVISDKPMTEEEWIKERATVIDGEATEVSRRLLPMRFPTPEQTNKFGKTSKQNK